jgi:hypothetical protein
MTYKLFETVDNGIKGVTRIDDDGKVWGIPFDPANTDYANFKKDLADGAELQDAEGNVIDGIAYLEGLA